MLNSEKGLFEKIREAGSHTMIYGLGAAVGSALNLLLLPLYTHYYTTEMYGILSLINLCGTLAGSFFYLGASSALARSYYDYHDAFERKKVVSTTLLLSLIGATAQIFLGILLGKPISKWLFQTDAYGMHVALIMLSSALVFVNNVFFMVLRFERLSKRVITVNLVSLTLTATLITSLLVYLRLGVMAPILGNAITQGLVCLLLLFSTREHITLSFSRPEVKIQLLFGLQAVVIALTLYAMTSLNSLFLNRYCTLKDVGIYSLGAQIGSSINILFIVPFGQIWAPMRMEYRNDRNAGEFFSRMLTYYAIVGIIVTATISLFSREAILLIAGHKEYAEAYRVVPFVMCGMLLYGSVNLIDYGIYFSRKVIYHAYIFTTASLFSLALNVLFVGRFGYMGAAGIVFTCYLLIACLVFVVSNKLYRIPFEGKRLALSGGIGALVLAAGFGAPISDPAPSIIFKAGLIVAMLILFSRNVLTHSEREKLGSLLRGIPSWKRQELPA